MKFNPFVFATGILQALSLVSAQGQTVHSILFLVKDKYLAEEQIFQDVLIKDYRPFVVGGIAEEGNSFPWAMAALLNNLCVDISQGEKNSPLKSDEGIIFEVIIYRRRC